ncbi:MAG TPA: c-type cytochrome [Thiobacillaceae bacterium]
MRQIRTSSAPRISAAWLAAVALLGPATAWPQAEIKRGTVIASTCFTCHGTNGESTSSIPSIDYIQPERMVEILKSYRSGQRVSTIMGRHASGYTDEEIVEVAKYLGSLQKRGK